MQITNWMTRNPVCVNPHDTLAKAGDLMAAGGFRQLPVTEQDKLIGIITDRDLRLHSGYLDSTQVDAAMTSPAVAVSPFDSAETAAKQIIKHKIGGLPVVDSGRVVGIISTSDLLRALLNVVEAARGIPEQ
ncbi:MAG: CBS domain-containing protein [Candidatus Binataceae bacterium]